MGKFLRKGCILACWPVLAFKQGRELARKKDRYRQLLSTALYLDSTIGTITSLAALFILVVLIHERAHLASIGSLLMLGFTAYTWKQFYHRYRLDRQTIRIDLVARRKFQRAFKPI